jgi:hypothetical protein
MIQTPISLREPTHIVSYWKGGRRAIVAVAANSDEEAIDVAIDTAGETDRPFAQVPYSVVRLR